VVIRLVTKSIAIPLLNFPGFWVGHFIPGNFLEKLLGNSFFPGGAGAVAGEIFINSYRDDTIMGKTKYLHRLSGALLETTARSAFQFTGYAFYIMMPYGSNISEHAKPMNERKTFVAAYLHVESTVSKPPLTYSTRDSTL